MYLNGKKFIKVVKLDADLAEKTITENGTYNASDDGVNGYSKVTVEAPAGKYNIEVVEKTDENGNKTQTLNITDWDYVPPQFDPVFANNTPAQISAVSAEIEKNGYNSTQVKEIFGWDLQADTKPITLTNGETIHIHFDGFLHDDKSDGTGKAGITFGTVDCLATTYKINDTQTNADGYFGSKFVTQDLPTIYNLLPEEWKAVIKPVDKKAANGGSTNYTETITQSCNIFLYSAMEIYASASWAQDGANEGGVYEYWNGKNNADRIKKHDTNADSVADTAISWWLRSSADINTEYFCNVWTSGGITRNNADNNKGISFAFCV